MKNYTLKPEMCSHPFSRYDEWIEKNVINKENFIEIHYACPKCDHIEIKRFQKKKQQSSFDDNPNNFTKNEEVQKNYTEEQNIKPAEKEKTVKEQISISSSEAQKLTTIAIEKSSIDKTNANAIKIAEKEIYNRIIHSKETSENIKEKILENPKVIIETTVQKANFVAEKIDKQEQNPKEIKEKVAESNYEDKNLTIIAEKETSNYKSNATSIKNPENTIYNNIKPLKEALEEPKTETKEIIKDNIEKNINSNTIKNKENAKTEAKTEIEEKKLEKPEIKTSRPQLKHQEVKDSANNENMLTRAGALLIKMEEKDTPEETVNKEILKEPQLASDEQLIAAAEKIANSTEIKNMTEASSNVMKNSWDNNSTQNITISNAEIINTNALGETSSSPNITTSSIEVSGNSVAITSAKTSLTNMSNSNKTTPNTPVLTPTPSFAGSGSSNSGSSSGGNS
ncbi:MAG: hypothetical protein OIF36_00895 [Alphaproteobacteria bacterium]|nr:hypothetical protein [Alphaproteobacteria bacterium]